MRLSDARLRNRQTKLIYPNHRFPPWLFFVWSSRSYIHVLARHRRVKGVTLTRLTDYRPLPLPVATLPSDRSNRLLDGVTWRIATLIASALNGNLIAAPRIPNLALPQPASNFEHAAAQSNH